jgi:hypothetical protein
MNMHLLRTIYYLIMVHYLCSGLKKMQCKYMSLSVQRKTTWRRRVVVSYSNFQVHGELYINPRSITLSILYHWKRLEVYFPTQLTDIDLEFCSKCYGCFSEDCSGCPVPPDPNWSSPRPSWSELDEAYFVPETGYLVLGFCERPPTQLRGMFLV